MTDVVPSPGSREARNQGCICAVMDNGHGRGYLGGMKDPETGETLFVITSGCPLHAPSAGTPSSRSPSSGETE